MKRVFGLLVMLVGCQQPTSVPPVETPQSVSQASAEIEFSEWPTATDAPINVSPQVAVICAVELPPGAARAGNDGEKRHGPHFKNWIVVRVNPGSIKEFKAGNAPLPVGTTVVKEKHHGQALPDPSTGVKAPVTEYGAMIKREPGYDPEHGDWEYLYVARQPEKQVTRGRLGSCIDCHSNAKEKDYLFRSYLRGKAVSGW